MKKTENLKLIISIGFVIIIALLFSNCNRKETTTYSDCGCNSKTLFTIPNDNVQVPYEEQTKGLLFYKRPDIIDDFYNDEEYNNRFWIFQGTQGCYNCQRHYIICNDELLGNEFDFLKQSNDSIEIRFTGNIKSLCILRAIPADYNYGEIVLNSILKNN